MDNVTHALAGGLLAAATVALSDRDAAETAPAYGRTAAVLGIVAAEFPDADLLYAARTMDGGNLAYLLHHRGHTHTVLFAVVSAIVLWAITLAVVKECRSAALRWPLLALALVGTCSHLLLDYSNNYGVHPFWPVNASWYYGDAVFIVEPWLWIVALPVLWFFTKVNAVRVACAIAFVGILAASWLVALVRLDTAIVLTIGAALWLMVVRAARAERRWVYGVFAWCAIEGVFFVASSTAQQAVRSAVTVNTFRTVALTPAPGNPLCFRALAVQVDGAEYQVTAATVAPFPGIRSAQACAGVPGKSNAAAAGSGAVSQTRTSLPSVHWEEQWVAPKDDLVALVKNNCEIAAALQFMRVPFWRVRADGRISFIDLRFGDGNGGFAEITTPPQRTACPGTPPGWNPPRADLLGE